MAGAGRGGAHEDTLLLIWGDHGQTAGGDHGGGTPAEVDSALVAVDLAALHRIRTGAALSDATQVQTQAGKAGKATSEGRGGSTLRDASAARGRCPADGGVTQDSQPCDAARQRVGAIEAARLRHLSAASPGAHSERLPVKNHAPTPDEAPAVDQAPIQHRASTLEHTARASWHQAPTLEHSGRASWHQLPQVDYAPTVASLLGVPTPFGSIGRVSPHLWPLRGCPQGAFESGGSAGESPSVASSGDCGGGFCSASNAGSCSSGAGDEGDGSSSCLAEYVGVLRRNAWQVKIYKNGCNIVSVDWLWCYFCSILNLINVQTHPGHVLRPLARKPTHSWL